MHLLKEVRENVCILNIKKKNTVPGPNPGFCRILTLPGDSVTCCYSVCTQVAIMGFWGDLVRCDELLCSVDKGGRGGVVGELVI